MTIWIAADRDVAPGHGDHDFKSRQGIAGGVGVNGGHRTVVAGVHRLEHVQGFTGSHFADDDAIGPHTQTVLHQIALGDFAFAFDVLRARFQSNHVRLLQLKFGRVFDRHHALFGGDVARKTVQQSCLTGTGAAADEHIAPRLHGGGEEIHDRGRKGAVLDEIFQLQRLGTEAANAHRRAIQRQRRDDCVHAAAVGETGIDHRAGFVDSSADQRDDSIDDLPKVLIIAEAHIDALEATFAFDVDSIVAVDQDVGDGRIFQESFQRPEAEGLVHDLVHEAFLIRAGEQAFFILAQIANHDAHFRANGVRRKRAKVLHVQALHQLLVNADFHLIEMDVEFGKDRLRLHRAGPGGRHARRNGDGGRGRRWGRLEGR